MKLVNLYLIVLQKKFELKITKVVYIRSQYNCKNCNGKNRDCYAGCSGYVPLLSIRAAFDCYDVNEKITTFGPINRTKIHLTAEGVAAMTLLKLKSTDKVFEDLKKRADETNNYFLVKAKDMLSPNMQFYSKFSEKDYIDKARCEVLGILQLNKNFERFDQKEFKDFIYPNGSIEENIPASLGMQQQTKKTMIPVPCLRAVIVTAL